MRDGEESPPLFCRSTKEAADIQIAIANTNLVVTKRPTTLTHYNILIFHVSGLTGPASRRQS
jgi:hypothetical protein